MRNVLVLVAALAAAGCVGKALQSGHETPSVVRLAVPASPPGEATTLAGAIAVARPRAASSLDTDRVAVRQPALGFDYYLGLRWSDPAPEMLQRLLVATLAADGHFAAAFAAPARVPAEYLLDVELRRFEAEYSAPDAAPIVRLEAQFTLVAAAGRQRLASFTLEASEAAQQNRQGAVVAAFDRAATQLLQEAALRLRAFESPPGS
jgi:cholesterol transport system auxiliary component